MIEKNSKDENNLGQYPSHNRFGRIAVAGETTVNRLESMNGWRIPGPGLHRQPMTIKK